MLALAIVPIISVAVKKFGRYLRELSHSTQAAAAVAASIAEVCRKEKWLLSYLLVILLCKTTLSELVKAFKMNIVKKITANLAFGVWLGMF